MEDIILYHSRELFYELGYFKTKISNITKKCGISTGMFYRHYDSKEELLVKIIKKDLVSYSKEVEILISDKGDIAFKLEMIIRLILSFLEKNPFFFSLLIELEERDEKFSVSTRKWINHFWDDTKGRIRELLKSGKKVREDREDLLASLVESHLKIYIRYLLSKKSNRYKPRKLIYLDMETEVRALSAGVLSTYRSLNAFSYKETIDHLTGTYTNRYFFELVEKAIASRKPIHLIYLDLTSFFLKSKNIFFTESILTDIGSLLRKNSRGIDSVGRLCNFKFIVLVLSDELPQSAIDSRIEFFGKNLKGKYPFVCLKDIVWKHLYTRPGEDILKKFRELKSIEPIGE